MAQQLVSRSNSKTNLAGLYASPHAAPFRLECCSSGMRRVSSEPSIAPLVSLAPPLRTSANGAGSASSAHARAMHPSTSSRPVSRLAALSSSFQAGIAARLGSTLRHTTEEGADLDLTPSASSAAVENHLASSYALHSDGLAAGGPYTGSTHRSATTSSTAAAPLASSAGAIAAGNRFLEAASTSTSYSHHRHQTEQLYQSSSSSAGTAQRQQRIQQAVQMQQQNVITATEQRQHATQPQAMPQGVRIGSGGAPFASLSRVLLVGQPSMFRSIVNRKWPATFGPLSLLLFLFGAFMAILAAVRASLVKRAKSCRCCRGFGLVRCRLCDGRGTVDWRAKFSYSEPCPLCLAKRFVACPDCGGHYHRPLFTHSRVAAPATAGAAPAISYSSSTTHPLD